MSVDVNTDGNRASVGVGLTVGERSKRCGSEGVAPTSQIGGLALPVPAEWLDVLVEAVADRLAPELAGVSPWMDRAAAAAYLGVPLSRLEKDRAVPSHRWDGRVLYHRLELDDWLLGMGAR